MNIDLSREEWNDIRIALGKLAQDQATPLSWCRELADLQERIGAALGSDR